MRTELCGTTNYPQGGPDHRPNQQFRVAETYNDPDTIGTARRKMSARWFWDFGDGKAARNDGSTKTTGTKCPQWDK